MKSQSFLTDNDAKELIVSACTKRPHTEDDLISLIMWAESARMDQNLLEMSIRGEIMIEWGNGEPMFSLTNGKEQA